MLPLCHLIPSTTSTFQHVRPILDVVKIQNTGDGEKSVAHDPEAVLKKIEH
jgi:hypothetical protein